MGINNIIPRILRMEKQLPSLLAQALIQSIQGNIPKKKCSILCASYSNQRTARTISPLLYMLRYISDKILQVKDTTIC